MRKNIVGERVKEARKAARPLITQSDLVARLQAEGLAIDQSKLSKIENGQRPVSDIEIVALAKALKVSLACLFSKVEGAPASSLKELEESYKQLQ